MSNIHVYTDSFSMYYTYTCWQFEYTPHCAIMRTLLLTQSVLVLTRSADVRINVIIIWFVHTLLVCVSVRFTDVCLWVQCDFLLFGQQHSFPEDEVVYLLWSSFVRLFSWSLSEFRIESFVMFIHCRSLNSSVISFQTVCRSRFSLPWYTWTRFMCIKDTTNVHCRRDM